MGFEDEIKRAVNRPKVCLQIDGPQNTHRFSDCGLKETNWWKPRIISVDGPRRSLDLQAHDVRSEETTIELGNADGMITDLFDAEQLQGKIGTLSLKMKDSSGTVYSQTQTKGTVEVRTMSPESVRIALRPTILERLGILQNAISAERLSSYSVPEDSVGLGWPILIGKVFATGTRGAVRVPMMDNTANAEKFLLHQGPGPANASAHLFRWRSGTWTDLGVSGGGNWTISICVADDIDNRFTVATLANGVYAAGDEYYWNGWGIPGEGYVVFDNSVIYYYIDSADSTNLPGHDKSDSFSIEAKFRIANTGNSDTIASVWDAAGVLADSAFWLRRELSNHKIYFYLSDGTNQYHALCDTTLVNTTTDDYTVRVTVDTANQTVRAWISKGGAAMVEQALTEYGTVPTAINTCSTAFCVGARDKTIDPQTFGGRIYYCIVADGAQPITVSGATGDNEDPLEDIISEYRFHQGIGHDYVGDNNLDYTGLPSASYTEVTDVLNTPARIMDTLLRQKWYWGLPTTLINRASFAALALEQEADGWNDSGDDWFAGMIPLDGDMRVDDNTPRLLQHLLLNQDAVIYENREGRLSIISADISTTGSGSYALLARHDFAENGPRVERRAFELRNKVRLLYQNAHKDGPEAFVTAEDQTSQAAFGITTEDVEQTLYFARHLDFVKELTNRQLLRSASDARRVILPVAGLRGLQHEIGDTIRVTHPQLPSGWEEKQVMITGLDPGLMTGSPTIEAVERGKVYGPLVYGTAGDAPQEYSITLTPELDTFVEETYKSKSHGSENTVYHGVLPEPLGDRGRCALRYALSEIAAASGTIISATLQIRTIDHYSGSVNFQLRQLNSTTWSESSTWNSFDGSGGWDDAYILSTALSDTVHVYSLDYHSFTLTAAGIAYLNGRVGADNKAQLTFFGNAGAGNVVGFASREHGTTAWRPQLTITYTA